MPATWRINDLIDLEYFLPPHGGPADAGPSESDSSDRHLYLSYAESHTPPYSRRDLIKFWVDQKRKTHRKEGGRLGILPGDTYLEAMGLTRGLLILAGLFSGAALAWSMLSYSGNTPINIFTCIWALLIPQLLLLAILALSMLFSRTGFPPAFKGLYALLTALFRQVVARTRNAAGAALSSQKRLALQAMAGQLGRQKTLYGPVFFWPVFLLAQIFAVFFNLGILSAFLIKISITDLAFGWQSTLHPGPESLFRLVEAASLPWSFMPSAHPTLSQIEGSQIILKDGMRHLSTPDLVSWWPFLGYALLWYGLLPRLILLATGISRQRRALNRLSFSTSPCDRLIHRMQTPRVQSLGRAYAPPHHRDAFPEPVNLRGSASDRDSGREEIPAVVLVPQDITGDCRNDLLNERLKTVLGLSMVRRMDIMMDRETDMDALAAALPWNDSAVDARRIVVLMEAWQPPIRETMDWLRGLRHTAGPRTGIIIALIGKIDARALLTPAAETDRMIWEQAVNGLGDPFLRVENLGGA